jgi:hypothetical protein
LNLWVSIVVGNSYPLTSSPRSAVFWFVAEPGAEPKPSRMAGYFSEIPSNLDLLPDRYFNLPLYKDEIWPNVQGAFDFVGFRDEAYFPSGYVSWRPDGSASYLIDPALNAKAFLDVISAQTGTSLAQAKVTLKETRAPGRIGVPIAEDYDAHIGFGRSATERPKPESGPLIEDRAYGAMLGLLSRTSAGKLPDSTLVGAILSPSRIQPALRTVQNRSTVQGCRHLTNTSNLTPF